MIQMKEKPGKRETRILGILYYINSIVWKYIFGKPADSLEKSTENADECIHLFISDMIADNEPLLSKYISIPKELSQLNCSALIAGVIEAILEGQRFVNHF